MITERMIINALIIGASFILVPFVISSTLTFDYLPIYLLVGSLALALAFFVLKDTLCICPLLGGSVVGAMNFLPLPLEAKHVACILLIIYFIMGYVVIRQMKIKVGKPKFFWPILVVTLILLYHNHALNVRVTGSDTEGGKPAILIYLAVLAYFCGINIATPSVDLLSKMPLYSVILAGISTTPFFLSTFIPGLAPVLYMFTSSVNVQAYVNSETGSGDMGGVSSRLADCVPLGMACQAYLLCRYPIGTWIRPERWWVGGLSLICVMLAIVSGYRSSLFGFTMLTMVGAWCYYSWRAIFLPVSLTILVLIGLIASTNNLIHVPTNKLPMIAQRSLSFLPGDWDEDAIESGESSNFFRKNIQDVYIKEYLKRSPWIGKGFSIDTKEFDYYTEAAGQGSRADQDYYQAKVFIEGQIFHTGWLSVYDIVGIIGGIAFVALGSIEIWATARFVFGPKADRRSSLFPLYVWILCNLVTMMLSFFLVFGDFKDTFINLCIYAIVLSHLFDIENTTETPIGPPDRKGQVEFSRLSGAYYGYQAKP
jgi:hypothetical protein